MQSGPHSNVTASLSELERKLVDLERELGAVAGAPVEPPSPPAAPAPTSGDLRAEIAELGRIRDQLETAARELVSEYDRLVTRLRAIDAARAADGPPA